MFPKLRFLSLILIFASIVPAQTTSEKNATEQVDTLRKDAVAFLRETLSDVNGMRSLENRISFTAEIAGLMWFHDEREARAMYTGVIADFKDLIRRYDYQMNELGITPKDADGTAGSMSFMIEPTDTSRLLRKFTTAMGVRQQIAMSIAEHDPDLAFGFYYDSLSSIANPELRSQVEGREDYLEFQLLGQLANRNAAKAVQYGVRSMDKGITFQHVELLKKIYAKDPDKGAEFGLTLLGRLKSGKSDNKDLYILSLLIDYGGQTLEGSRKPDGKKPVYSLSDLRELSEILAQAIMSRSGEQDGSVSTYVHTVEKYLPGRAAQLRAKFKVPKSDESDLRRVSNVTANVVSTSGYSNSAYANANVDNDSYPPEAREQAELEGKLMDDVQSLGTKELPKEEREKIVAQARKIIMQTPGRDKKILSLSMLAAQVSKMGDKELASEIMRDAERLVNPAPKNMKDFMLSWVLASGYAEADPDKAFPLLEETIGRANDTLAAFVKVGEFIDVAEEMIQDGEVQVGVFGGQMIRGLTSELGMADATIKVLAKADFVKTKGLANRFDRPEVRVLAKMMVLRAVLSPKQEPTPLDVEGSLNK